MSEEADALAEMARNRGLKLVRSRVRTPAKRAFGKYGLTDANGTKLLGLDGKHPSATAEEVESYLRKGLVSDWAGSLGVAAPPVRKPRAARAKPPPKPKPEPTPKLRPARAGDAEAIVGLVALLGHAVEADGVRKRIRSIKVPQLVVTLGAEVIGLCGLDMMHPIHRNAAVGRLTILVVAERARDRGLGRMLVEAAERTLADLGCGMVEVTSNNRLTQAHRFYAHLGFDQTSKRFAKRL